MFAKYFIKNKPFPIKFNNYLSQLSEERGVADYDFDDDFTKEDALEALRMVQEFMTFIKQNYL